jgi:hypothetical protein
VGAGRRAQDARLTWLKGNPGKRGKTPPDVPKVAEIVGGPVERPTALLKKDALEVWDALAPLAVELRTLTPATAYAFAWLCRTLVLERALAKASATVGGPNHRGVMQRLEGLMARFRILPDGKPVVIAEAPADAWSEFDGPHLVKGA